MSVNLCVNENDYLLVKKEFGGTELCPPILAAGECPIGDMDSGIKNLLSEIIAVNVGINNQMWKLIDDLEYKFIKDVISYIVELPNTRDRANCMRWSLKRIKKEFSSVQQSLAASVELVHLATLIVDEIFDETETCGKEDADGHPIYSTWREFKSKGRAFSAAEILVSLAVKNAVEVCKSEDAYDKMPFIIDKLSQTIRETYAGQSMDLTFQSSREIPSPEEYFSLITTLEGNPLKFAIEIGLSYAGATDREMEILGECGCLLGQVFKLRNDIIDIIGHEKALGKNIAEDIKIKSSSSENLILVLEETKKTLPIIHFIKDISEEESRLDLGEGVSITKDSEIGGATNIEHAKSRISNYLQERIIPRCEGELKNLGYKVLGKLNELGYENQTQLEEFAKFVSTKFSLD